MPSKLNSLIRRLVFILSRVLIVASVVICVITSVVSCGGTGSDTLPPGFTIHRSGGGGDSTIDSLSRLQGVYRGSVPRKSGCTLAQDENYIYISSTGQVSWFDYEGDACGTGENCYAEVESPPFTPQQLRDDTGVLLARLSSYSSSWVQIQFFAGTVYDGTSFEVTDPESGQLLSLAGNTEQPFGTRVSNPSIADIRSQRCN